MKVHDIRCTRCGKKLAEGIYTRLAIKCPRCRCIGQFLGNTPTTPERQRVPNLKQERHRHVR